MTGRLWAVALLVLLVLAAERGLQWLARRMGEADERERRMRQCRPMPRRSR